jgi:hypothetical protein
MVLSFILVTRQEIEYKKSPIGLGTSFNAYGENKTKNK